MLLISYSNNPGIVLGNGTDWGIPTLVLKNGIVCGLGIVSVAEKVIFGIYIVVVNGGWTWIDCVFVILTDGEIIGGDKAIGCWAAAFGDDVIRIYFEII